MDFSYPRALPWQDLITRILEIETIEEPQTEAVAEGKPTLPKETEEELISNILAYLTQRGYRMASFDRLRKSVDSSITDDVFDRIISDNPRVFRHARLKGGNKGLAKVVP